MNKPIKVSLSILDFRRLKKASDLRSAPMSIQDTFRELDIPIKNTSKLIKSIRWNACIYLFYKQDWGLRVFTIQNKSDARTMASGRISVEIEDISPTFSNNINDYPIYHAGITETKNGKVTYINGRRRDYFYNSGKKKQLQKWDYFFQASSDILTYPHRFIIDDLQQDVDAYTKKRNNKVIKAVLFVIASIFLLIYFREWLLFVTIIILSAVYKFRQIFFMVYRLTKSINYLQYASEELEEEMDFLKAQIDQQPATDKQMRKWLDDEILKLDQIAQNELQLGGTILLEPKLKNRETAGLNIEEWGTIQSEDVNGKKMLYKFPHIHNQLAVRRNSGAPMYAIYYITLIYLTDDGLGRYSCFYDFIEEKAIGTITNSYHYSDIVSIGTKVVETTLLNNSLELETKQTIISFKNNESIIITLTDQRLFKSLGEQIEAARMLEEHTNIQSSHLLEQLMEIADDSLPATRSNAILTNIKDRWVAIKKLRDDNFNERLE